MSNNNYVAIDPDDGRICGIYSAPDIDLQAIVVEGKTLTHRLATDADLLPPEEPTPYVETDLERDRYRYLQRATAKDSLIAEMAAENMGRIRSGIWTVPDLISLTTDPEIATILQDIQTLSFELAASKLMACSNPLITTAIKQVWIQRLLSHA